MLQQKYDPIVFSGSGVNVTIPETAQKALLKYRQHPGECEAGGMLFGKIKGSNVTVECISTPSVLDRRAPSRFIWHKGNANKEIVKNYNRGLHYLGDWHSHSQKTPLPSHSDIESIRSTFNESVHDLNFFIMFILSDYNVQSSFVALTNGHREYRLNVK